MDRIIILIIACIVLNGIDYLTALRVLKKNFLAFRQYETSKSLVWYAEQYKLTGNKRYLKIAYIYPLITLVVAIIIAGAIGYFVFDLKFLIGIKIFLITQIIASCIGIIGNTISFYRIDKEKWKPKGKQNQLEYEKKLMEKK